MDTALERYCRASCCRPSTLDALSEARLSLIRRAATLELQLEQLECAMSEGKDVDIEGYGRVASHLRRILEAIGVERKPRYRRQPRRDCRPR